MKQKVILVKDKFEHKAFICHSKLDHSYAKKLHENLENYRAPRKIAKQLGKDRIGDVVLDDATFKAGPLNEAISEKLRKSEWLIVLCSPNARNKSDCI